MTKPRIWFQCLETKIRIHDSIDFRDINARCEPNAVEFCNVRWSEPAEIGNGVVKARMDRLEGTQNPRSSEIVTLSIWNIDRSTWKFQCWIDERDVWPIEWCMTLLFCKWIWRLPTFSNDGRSGKIEAIYAWHLIVRLCRSHANEAGINWILQFFFYILFFILTPQLEIITNNNMSITHSKI